MAKDKKSDSTKQPPASKSEKEPAEEKKETVQEKPVAAPKKPTLQSVLKWIDDEQVRNRTPLPERNSFESGRVQMLSQVKGKLLELE